MTHLREISEAPSTPHPAQPRAPGRFSVLLLVAMLVWSAGELVHEAKNPSSAKLFFLASALLLSHAADHSVREKRLRWLLNGLALVCVGLVVWIRLHQSA